MDIQVDRLQTVTVIDVLVLGDANPDLVLRGDVVPRWPATSAADRLVEGDLP